jgi:hypothetical protein
MPKLRKIDHEIWCLPYVGIVREIYDLDSGAVSASLRRSPTGSATQCVPNLWTHRISQNENSHRKELSFLSKYRRGTHSSLSGVLT